MNEQNYQWPILDFDKFPNGAISGLTLSQIQNVMADNNDDNSFLDDILDVEAGEPHSSTNRFINPVSDDELIKLKNDSIPKGTNNRNKWALNLYDKWAQSRLLLVTENKFILPSKDDLINAPVDAINYWLSKFVYEIRKVDGAKYPRNTLVTITAGINTYLNTQRSINLFQDDHFSHFRSILDLACKEASKAGVGTIKRQAEVITEAEENLLWDKGALGDSTPRQLIDTLLYLNGLHFALRSGQEHRDLTTDQIKILEPCSDDDNYIIEYHENISKTNSGGLKHRRLEPKVVRHVDTVACENPNKSHALLLKKYLSLRPLHAPNNFYLTPLSCHASSGAWFKTIPIGHNTLAGTVKRLCSSCGIEGYKTNHSLRATCATRLYENDVDEQIIMERTGHRTTTGVRSYKRTSHVHHHNSSIVIDNKSLKNHLTSSTSSLNFNFHSGCNVNIYNK